MVGRGTESAEVRERRLATARDELAAQDDFDVVVVNEQLEFACSELVSLLMGHHAGSGVNRSVSQLAPSENARR